MPCYYLRHGMYRTDHLIYNDPELSFLESIPQSALFTPNPSLEDTVASISSNKEDATDDNEVAMETSPHSNDNERESESEDEEQELDRSEKDGDGDLNEAKAKSSALNSTPVPLGWPKVTMVTELHVCV